jgi:hypothetical protein
MSNENKVLRSEQEVQQDYGRVAAKCGNLCYQISELTKELELVKGVMRDLNFEFVAVRRAQEESKIAAATPVLEGIN